jgi:membrane protease subunit HflK
MSQIDAKDRTGPERGGGRPPAPPARAGEVSMDPAQQSLAEALRITFRVIQLVMVLLVVLFLASGFDTVSEGERGVRLAFGKVQESDLSPGRQFHLPYPMGELVKVSTGQRTLSIDRAFYPELSPNQLAQAVESLAGRKQTLQPGRDGSLVTGDGNIAHARWTVQYRVDDVARFVENLHREDVDAIVRSAVERGVVQTVAGLSIDQFLKQSLASSTAAEGEAIAEASIESRVRAVAQETLDAMQSGLRIDRVTLDDRIPPLYVYAEFQSVSTAEAQAATVREQALRGRRQLLNSVAGAAHEELIALIDAYEVALAGDNRDEADQTLERILAVIDGAPVGENEETISGEVTSTINDARRYRTNVRNQAQTTAARFEAKLAQYRTNPSVFIANEWTSAYRSFLSLSSAELFPIPPNSSTLELILNSDPDIARELEMQRNRQQAEENLEGRFESVLEQRRRERREEERRQGLR